MYHTDRTLHPCSFTPYPLITRNVRAYAAAAAGKALLGREEAPPLPACARKVQEVTPNAMHREREASASPQLSALPGDAVGYFIRVV